MLHDDEKKVLDLTTDLWNTYIKLSVQHPEDQDEFRHALHVLQHLVMIREPRRNHPDLFYIQEENSVKKIVVDAILSNEQFKEIVENEGKNE